MFLRDYLDDVASDMSAFHRIDDILDLDGPALWKLAWRLGAYQGRMAVIIQDLRDQEEGGAPRGPSPAAIGPVSGPPIQGTAEVLSHHPAFAADGIFAPVFSSTTIPADAN